VVLALTVAGVAATAWAFLGGGAPGEEPRPAADAPPQPASSPLPSARTVALADVRVHSGEAAELPYRLEGPEGTAWDLEGAVTTPAGERVKAWRIASGVAPAGRRTCTVVVDLPAGRYTYAVLAREAAGDREAAGAGDAGAGDGGAGEPDGGAGEPDGGVAAGAGEAAADVAKLVVLPPRPPAFPGERAVADALAWAERRQGDVAVAVVDSHGTMHGLREHRAFQSASLVKAMLLVAVLRHDPHPPDAEVTALERMIQESDNASAGAVYARVGGKGLRRVAELAGMRDFKPGTGWIDARISAADQARFFHEYERYVPAAARPLARRLLGGITTMQRWGIPAAAGPAGWTTYHKSGWLGLDNRLMVQAAWLEKGKRRWALAVLTDDNPSRTYGWDTQKGVAGLLLGEEPTPAYLARTLEY
jgi:hypothetical protein